MTEYPFSKSFKEFSLPILPVVGQGLWLNVFIVLVVLPFNDVHSAKEACVTIIV